MLAHQHALLLSCGIRLTPIAIAKTDDLGFGEFQSMLIPMSPAANSALLHFVELGRQPVQ
jgi:hypothetical protein